MLVTYAPSDPDVPIWRVIEVTGTGRRIFWRVRLWTEEVKDFKNRRRAIAAYWE